MNSTKNNRTVFIVDSPAPPVVTVDNEAQALYVHFNRRARVAKTKEVLCNREGVITVDLDRKGKVVGIEAIGVDSVSIRTLCQKAHVAAPRTDFAETRWQPAFAATN
ncbi:MAG: DUF2283 domain-containing protein [Verrucomicrobiales bacterium]|jgi:uncharacterized protein YuzE|nr:DUF2283 domain-containing protein [Verrucomicrobiales bacterium]